MKKVALNLSHFCVACFSLISQAIIIHCHEIWQAYGSYHKKMMTKIIFILRLDHL